MSVERIPECTIVGRSSSHFTRVTRIFAAELGVAHSFRVVPDLLSNDTVDYGGNPSLKLPALATPRGTWFGTLSICRELARVASRERGAQEPKRIVWPEDLVEPLSANAQELVLQAMATEVVLVMSRVGGASEATPYTDKMRRSLTNTLAWLDDHVAAALAVLPASRDLCFLETTLFCLVTHLEFRQMLPALPCPALDAFCRRFSARASARETAYRFDA